MHTEEFDRLMQRDLTISEDEIVILGENIESPCVCIETTQEVYNCVRTDEFDVGVFNALLMAVVTYLDVHDIEYDDKALPWAESTKVA